MLIIVQSVIVLRDIQVLVRSYFASSVNNFQLEMVIFYHLYCEIWQLVLMSWKLFENHLYKFVAPMASQSGELF